MVTTKLDALEELLEHGFAPHTQSPPARYRGAKTLPQTIAHALAQHSDPEKLDLLRAKLLQKHWPDLIERQAGAIGNGWNDFMSAAAVVVDLIHGKLPIDVARHLANSPALNKRYIDI